MTHRRLTGPTLICLIIAGLVADYLYLGDSRWSIVAFVSKVVSILGKVFGPALNPALYGWLDRFLVPLSLILFGLILLWLIVARAKTAMRRATTDAGEAVLPLNSVAPAQAVAAGAAFPPSDGPRRSRLAWKLIRSFGAVTLTFTAIAGILTYTRMAREIDRQIKHRAGLSAMTLSTMAARAGRDYGAKQLELAVASHASSRAIAYIYVEDGSGQIVAHAPPDLPRFLGSALRRIGKRDIGWVATEYRGLPVFRVVESVTAPQRGYVHLALWQHAIDEQARRDLLPVFASMFVLVCAAWGGLAWIVWYLISPFSELAQYASRLSRGELELDLAMAPKSDEIGELARSFSRMRSSLYAVLIRLKGAAPTNQSNELR